MPELPDCLYFHVSGVMPSGFILQFSGQQDETEYAQRLADYLQRRKPAFNWNMGGAVHQITTLVDNFSPARIDSFLFAQPAHAEQAHENVDVYMRDGRCIPVHLELMVVSFYTFNSAVFHGKATIPKEYWGDIEVLRRVRYFLQKNNATIDGYNTDLEAIYAGMFRQIQAAVLEAVEAIKPPVVKSQFLDLTTIDSTTEYAISWSHATLMLLSTKQSIKQMVEGYGPVLIRNIPGGLRNYSISDNEYVYVESGNSIVIKPMNFGDDIEQVQQHLFADWLFWIGTEHYTWKVVWELDRILYVVLTTVTSHLRQKLDSPYQDIYELNGLLNYIQLLLDVLTPRNLTSNFSKIHFLEQVHIAWQTNDMRAAAEKKMEQLALVVGQLNEIKSKRQSKRLELLLTGLSIISLGTLISNLLRLSSSTANWPDWALFTLAIGLPAFLAIGVLMFLSQE